MKFEAIIKERLSPGRFEHSRRVAETAIMLAENNGVNLEKTLIAALLHDYARELPLSELNRLAGELGLQDEFFLSNPDLLHAPIGAYLVENKLGINDPEILSAIASHTLGRRKMTSLEQIIYLADMIEPGRKYPGVESLREKAAENLREGMLAALDYTIRYLVDEGKTIHPNTIEARNSLIMEG